MCYCAWSNLLFFKLANKGRKLCFLLLFLDDCCPEKSHCWQKAVFTFSILVNKWRWHANSVLSREWTFICLWKLYANIRQTLNLIAQLVLTADLQERGQTAEDAKLHHGESFIKTDCGKLQNRWLLCLVNCQGKNLIEEKSVDWKHINQLQCMTLIYILIQISMGKVNIYRTFEGLWIHRYLVILKSCCLCVCETFIVSFIFNF